MWIIICLCTWFTVSDTCKRIRESASLWEHGAMVFKSVRIGEQRTEPCVLYTSFPSTCIRAICSASRANNSVLFLFTRKKLCQFPGNGSGQCHPPTQSRSSLGTCARFEAAGIAHITDNIHSVDCREFSPNVWHKKQYQHILGWLLIFLCLASGLWMPHRIQQHEHGGFTRRCGQFC